MLGDTIEVVDQVTPCTDPTIEHTAWVNMRQRCNNPRNKDYRNYGGRGITVCSEWNASFEVFYADMGAKPVSHWVLDRIDNDGPYAPWNCRWTDAVTSSANRRPYSQRNNYAEISRQIVESYKHGSL